MLSDPLANVLSCVLGAERLGRSEVIVTPASKIVLEVLEVFRQYGYVKEFSVESKARGGRVKVVLSGTVNKCGVIKPRFAVQCDALEKFEKRYLPAKGMGVLLVSTTKGLLSHLSAREQNIGGRLIAYCY